LAKPDLKIIQTILEPDVDRAIRLRREAAEIEAVILRGALEAAAEMATKLRATAELGAVTPGVRNELLRMADEMDQRLKTVESIQVRA
jgi:hypothetical protein